MSHRYIENRNPGLPEYEDVDDGEFDIVTLLVVMLNLGPATPGNQRNAGVS